MGRTSGANKMKLYWSSRSPYVRKVMVAAHELGLADQLVLERTLVSGAAVNEAMLAANPLGKIPCLALASGESIYDSPVICEYLNDLASDADPSRSLFPQQREARLIALRWQALGDGLMDLSIARLGELRGRPEALRSEAVLHALVAKTNSVLDALTRQTEHLVGQPFGIGHISIGSALSYLDFRFGDHAWRDNRTDLTEWHRAFAQRPSVQATEHVDA